MSHQRRERSIAISDVRQLGGLVSIVRGPDPVDLGGECWRLNYASPRGVVFLNTKIRDRDRAVAAGEVLSELLGARLEEK